MKTVSLEPSDNLLRVLDRMAEGATAAAWQPFAVLDAAGRTVARFRQLPTGPQLTLDPETVAFALLAPGVMQKAVELLIAQAGLAIGFTDPVKKEVACEATCAAKKLGRDDPASKKAAREAGFAAAEGKDERAEGFWRDVRLAARQAARG